MATQATYYLDAPSLSSATVIYSDAGLTTVAPDGFYSDGTISREQSSGVLLPQTSCPSCATPCGGSISGSGAQGIYYLSTDLGTDTGAVIVTFNPYSIPDGILATFNSINYNGLSSPYYGWLQGSAGLPTYIGQIAEDCGIVSGSPHTLDEYEYNGSAFASLGSTTSVSVVSGQLDLTTGGPGNCVMVIPKTTASPSILDLQFIGPCLSTAFEISVSCPAILTSFDSSTVQVSSVLACADAIDQVYYVAHVTGAAGVLGLYDLVFSDGNGEFKLAAGYYKTNDAGANNWFQVDANGVIIAFGTCGTPPAESYNCVSGNCVDPGDGSGTYSTLAACQAACTPPPVESYNCVSGNCVDPGDGSGTYSTLAACQSSCGVSTVTVTSVFGYMEPCIGGTIDDHMGASVTLNNPVAADTTFNVDVSYVIPPNSCAGTPSVQSFTVDILAGQTSSNFNACSSGAYFSGGANICSACISGCSDPTIDLSTYGC